MRGRKMSRTSPQSSRIKRMIGGTGSAGDRSYRTPGFCTVRTTVRSCNCLLCAVAPGPTLRSTSQPTTVKAENNPLHRPTLSLVTTYHDLGSSGRWAKSNNALRRWAARSPSCCRRRVSAALLALCRRNGRRLKILGAATTRFRSLPLRAHAFWSAHVASDAFARPAHPQPPPIAVKQCPEAQASCVDSEDHRPRDPQHEKRRCRKSEPKPLKHAG